MNCMMISDLTLNMGSFRISWTTQKLVCKREKASNEVSGEERSTVGTHVVKFVGEGNDIWSQSLLLFLSPAALPELLRET